MIAIFEVNIQIKKFGPGDRDNPGDCKNKGYVNIQSEKCYFNINIISSSSCIYYYYY